MTHERPHAVKRRKSYRWVLWAILAVLWITILSAYTEIGLLSHGADTRVAHSISDTVLVLGMCILYHRMHGYWEAL